MGLTAFSFRQSLNCLPGHFQKIDLAFDRRVGCPERAAVFKGKFLRVLARKMGQERIDAGPNRQFVRIVGFFFRGIVSETCRALEAKLQSLHQSARNCFSAMSYQIRPELEASL